MTGLMSIIGYIMGIGDRPLHPSNILFVKQTGTMMHIDFCFEKASLRTYVQETVPFRWTRRMMRALGPSDVHGVFTVIAEYVMGLMRRNREICWVFWTFSCTIRLRIRFCTQRRWTSSQASNVWSLIRKGKERAIARVSDKFNGREFLAWVEHGWRGHAFDWDCNKRAISFRHDCTDGWWTDIGTSC